MTDIVTPKVRSRMMSGIRGKNTKPELIVRKALHRLGFRYRLHDRSLPGRPDLVLPKYQAVIFVHGCFWHGHNCHLFKWPSTRVQFWRNKIETNQAMDARSLKELANLGWRVGIIWECALKGRTKLARCELTHRTTNWLKGDAQSFEVGGHDDEMSDTST